MSTVPEALPSLQDAVLDSESLQALFRDLSSLVEIDEILLKGGAQSRAVEQRLSLEEARAALEQGRVMGLQIRYRYQGSSWWDTLLRTPQGIRIVRIQPPRFSPSSS
jgi:hypothetical protein